MQSYVINFIRHGMTQANINGQYAGVIDIPVCEEGFERLEKLKSNHTYPKVHAYYSSPLTRCRQTCKVIYPEAKPVIIDGLKECNFGDWEGKTSQELSGNKDYKAWLDSGQRLTPPNGESGIEFKDRLCGTFEKLVEDLMKNKITTSAVFTHGGVIMFLLATYGIPKKDPFEFMVANGCGYSVRITPGLWMRDKVFEICDKIPFGHNIGIEGKFKEMIDEQKGKLEI